MIGKKSDGEKQEQEKCGEIDEREKCGGRESDGQEKCDEREECGGRDERERW